MKQISRKPGSLNVQSSLEANTGTLDQDIAPLSPTDTIYDNDLQFPDAPFPPTNTSFDAFTPPPFNTSYYYHFHDPDLMDYVPPSKKNYSETNVPPSDPSQVERDMPSTTPTIPKDNHFHDPEILDDIPEPQKIISEAYKPSSDPNPSDVHMSPITATDFETTYSRYAKRVIWPGGTLSTYLPWLSDPENPEQNLLQNVGCFFLFFYIFLTII